MFESFRNIFKIPELRKRIFFTIAVICVYRIGRHLPTPGIDLQVLHDIMSSAGAGGSDLLGLIDMFSGGNMKNFTIFALGIMPYISSSIIFQLLQAVVPGLEKLAKEGEYGKKKITQYMRIGTVVLSVVQAFGISLFLAAQPGMVTMDIWAFRLLTILTMTTGTIFIMWLGEQITERGHRQRHQPYHHGGHHRRISAGSRSHHRVGAQGDYPYLFDSDSAGNHDHGYCSGRHHSAGATKAAGAIRQTSCGQAGDGRTSHPYSA